MDEREQRRKRINELQDQIVEAESELALLLAEEEEEGDDEMRD